MIQGYYISTSTPMGLGEEREEKRRGMCDLKDEHIGSYFNAFITCLTNIRN